MEFSVGEAGPGSDFGEVHRPRLLGKRQVVPVVFVPGRQRSQHRTVIDQQAVFGGWGQQFGEDQWSQLIFQEPLLPAPVGGLGLCHFGEDEKE